MSTQIKDIHVSTRLRNVLVWVHHIETVEELALYTRRRFGSLRHVGHVLLAEADALLEQRGLSWRMEDAPERLAQPCPAIGVWDGPGAEEHWRNKLGVTRLEQEKQELFDLWHAGVDLIRWQLNVCGTLLHPDMRATLQEHIDEFEASFPKDTP